MAARAVRRALPLAHLVRGRPLRGLAPQVRVLGWGGLGAGLSSKGAEQGVEGLQTIGVIALSIVLIAVVGFFAWIVILASAEEIGGSDGIATRGIRVAGRE
jgi:hypothetical protein